MRPSPLAVGFLHLALLAGAPGLGALPPASAAETPGVATYIVVLAGEPPKTADAAERVRAVAAALIAEHGGSVERVYGSALNGFSARLTAAQAKAIGADKRVRYVEADSEMRTQSGK